MNNNYLYGLLGVFVLYFNKIIILNEKFLLLLIFIAFCVVVRKYLQESIVVFFSDLQKELVNEIFLYEYNIDAKYSFIYHYLNLDLLRKKLFYNSYKFYLKSLNFLIILYSNINLKKRNNSFIQSFENLVNEVYYFILKKYSFIKLNFLYRSYYYIFYKFQVV